MKLFVINLDRSSDRLNHISQQFSELNLGFERVAGVDGNLLSCEEYNHLISVSNWPLKLTNREVGCFLSHRKCLKMIAEGVDPYGAVFEDDIILSKNSTNFLSNWDWIPIGTDLVKLDTAQIKCILGRPTEKLKDGYRLAPLMSKHYCTAGYIISRDCAKKLYDLTEYATAPIDEIFFNPDCGVMNMFNIEQMYPAIIIQAGLNSTIRGQLDDIILKKVKEKKHRSLKQKLIRELKRFKKRYAHPIWLVFTKGYRWKLIPFR